MNKNIIFKICVSWFMGALFLYSYLGSELKYKSLMLFISVVGIIIFPFAKWAVETSFSCLPLENFGIEAYLWTQR
ncbi:hypothetical protein J4731_11220 [Providencia rettgeri]|nr:hypothetical protein [Providencia rettgeri]